MNWTPAVSAAAMWLLGAYGFFWLGSALISPDWFIRTLSFRRLSALGSTSGGERWWHDLVALLTLLSVGRVTYCSSYAIAFIIPAAAGIAIDGDDGISFRAVVQMTFAALTTVSLVPALERRALSGTNNP